MKFDIKKFRRSAARTGMFTSAWMFQHLPYAPVKCFMHVCVTIAFQLTGRLKKIARDSLNIAFKDELSEDQKDDIIRKCFQNLGRGMIEMVYYTLHPHMIRDKISIRGAENLDEALKSGRGVVVVTAHYGNFPLMMLKIVQMGYKANVLMRKTRDPKIDKMLLGHRTRLGLGTIYSEPRRVCVQNCLRALKRNEILFILIDQHFGSEGGVYVDFFGEKAATAPGAVVFAERSKSPIVPMFIRRVGGDFHEITIQPQFSVERRDDYDEMLRVNIQKITSIIEKEVRQHPEEWGWMHRRWKGKA